MQGVKCFTFFFLLSCPVFLLAQFRLIEANTESPVSFGHVLVKGKNVGTIADYEGRFSLDTLAFGFDSLQLSCIGYKTKYISVKELKTLRTISLNVSSLKLEEVTITSEQRKLLTKQFGITGKPKRMLFGNTITANNGDEKAIFISNDLGVPGKLQSVNIYVSDVGIPDAHFRLHIYNCNLIEIKPEKELTCTNIITAATTGNEWVTVDLSELNIRIGETGCFVGIEWFDSPKSSYFRDSLDVNYQVYRNGKYKDTADVIVRRGNGMSLGAVHKNYLEASNSVWVRSVFNQEWSNQVRSFASRRIFNVPDTFPNGRVFTPSPENSYYQVPRIYVEALLPKNKVKAAYKKPPKRKLNKIENIKENSFSYPQSSVLELFTSVKKAINNDDIDYVLKYLCVYKKGELNSILEELENLKKGENLLSDKEKEEMNENLDKIISGLNISSLSKVEEKYFELKVDGTTYNLTLGNGLWKVNPNSYKIYE